MRSTDENGEVFFDNLDQGKYEITEVKTQPGRALLKEPIVVTLPLTMTEEEANENGSVDFTNAQQDSGYTDKWFFYECTYRVINNAVLDMPVAGGNGVWKYGFIGVGMIAMIGTTWVVLEKRKTKKYHKHKKMNK